MAALADGEITGESVKILISHLDKSHAALKHNQATLTWLLTELCNYSSVKRFLKFHR